MNREIKSECDCTHFVESPKLIDVLRLNGAIQKEEMRFSEAVERAKKDLRK